ncbi:pancreatic triacylglycerol lipase isoform X2 [Diachasma alloeum]|uniref:pancreatic triacylglycerol lipase isoform X2 n=1 Tax=Diachasma alloeum TaxID=454923 RepID=UPI00073845E1|nr:pancreatic triacylglycerol lipase isoform X2 [Diachasma alloeum]
MMTPSLILVALCGLNAGTTASPKLESIFLRLWLSERNGSYKDAHVPNASALVPYMDINKNTAVFIHGFTQSINSNSVATIVEAYLKRGDHNIVAVDWSELAGGNYMQVISQVEEVGAYIAQGINGMLEDGISPSRIHVVGHSMGAHVAGTVGLDPAGPLFNFFNERISSTDAQFVDIIHTDAGFYGLARPTGSVDFWPNRGTRVQPGCPSNSRVYSEEDFCSHHRSYLYYAESLINENAFLSVKCSSEAESSKKNTRLIPMGYAAPVDTSGSYCLVTSANEPFGLAAKGALRAPNPISLLLPIAS